MGVYFSGKFNKPLRGRFEEDVPQQVAGAQVWKPAKARHQVKKSVLMAEADRDSTESEDDAGRGSQQSRSRPSTRAGTSRGAGSAVPG